MIQFDQSPTFKELLAALKIPKGDQYPGVTISGIYSDYGMAGKIRGVDIKAERYWVRGRGRYLRRAVFITCPKKVLQFDDDAFHEKLAELIPVGKESIEYQRALDSERAETKKKMDVIGARLNAVCPDGRLHRMSDEWLLSERPVYSKRFTLDHFQLDPPDGTPVFNLTIRGLNEAQVIALLQNKELA